MGKYLNLTTKLTCRCEVQRKSVRVQYFVMFNSYDYIIIHSFRMIPDGNDSPNIAFWS